jgi:hypothetical protein
MPELLISSYCVQQRVSIRSLRNAVKYPSFRRESDNRQGGGRSEIVAAIAEVRNFLLFGRKHGHAASGVSRTLTAHARPT